MKTTTPIKFVSKIFFVFFLFPFLTYSQSTQTYATSGSYTYTVPSGVTELTFSLWGAGGGAANGHSDDSLPGGGGGAGGGFISHTIDVIPGDIITIEVGAGGAGATTEHGDGADGGDSQVYLNGSLVLEAYGGYGGEGSGSYAGGTGRSGSNYGDPGAITYTGGDGGDAIDHTGGGGGGAAGTSDDGEDGEDGDDGDDGEGGEGGDDCGGDGGTGTHRNDKGGNGNFPGGGGGGAGHENTDGGGDGANGMVIIGVVECNAVATNVNFDGDDDYVSIEGSLVEELEEVTMMAWIKIAEGASGNRWIMGEDVAEFKIENSGKLKAKFKTEDKDVEVKTIGNVFTETDTWYHVATSYNANTNFIGLYINGVDYSQVIKNENDSDEIEESDTDFEIGRKPGEDNEYFEGSICEVKVFNKSLSQQEIQRQVYQKIQNTDDEVHGVILDRAIGDLNWEDLVLYVSLIEDESGFFNISDASDLNNEVSLLNMDEKQDSNAPLPFVAYGSGKWGDETTWEHGGVWKVENIEETQPWAIARLEEDVHVTLTDINVSVLGLIIPESSSVTMEGITDIETGTGTGSSLTVSKLLILGGVIDLEGESQFFQDEDAVNIVGANGYMERDQQGTLDTYTYNYWSSPVSSNGTDFTLGDIMPDVDFISGLNGTTAPLEIAEYWIWKFTNATNGDYSSWVHAKSTGQIKVGEGFTMKGPGTGISDFQNYVFRGEPNNGTFLLPINAGNDYLVGNPYPSALDADQFILDNEAILRDDFGTGGALLFWEHWGGGSHQLKEYQGGYAYYTLSGGVQAPSHEEVSQIGAGSKTPGNSIPVGQGFFVTAEADGNIEFNNNQRVFAREQNTSSIFMKSSEESSKQISQNKVDLRTKIRLGVDMPKGYHRQLLITEDTRSTDGVDYGFEALLADDLHNDMFWVLEDKKFIVQGVPKLNKSTEIPFGFKMHSSGTMRVGLDEVENIFEDAEFFIKDLNTGETYSISDKESFEIELEEGEYLNKYSLVFQPRLKSLNEVELEEGISIYMNNNTRNLMVDKIVDTSVNAIEVYNTLGQKVGMWNPEAQNREYALYFNKNTGVYFVRVSTENGIVKKKIIVN